MSDPAKNIWPVILLDDAAGVLGLLEALGFRPTTMMESDGVVHHGQLAWPEGGGVMLGSADREGSQFSKTPHGPALVYVVTDDPDEIHRRAVEHGAEIVMPPTDQDYGSREFSVRDVDGNVWSFGTYRGAPMP
jgi:uncharacterized glyoxalase superfamily protein PhnB